MAPGRINAYAQAVIQTMREDEHERGCLAEERVLGGDLTYHRPDERLPADEERFVLLAMHEILVERGLCLREHNPKAEWVAQATRLCRPATGRTEFDGAKKSARPPRSERRVAARNRPVACSTLSVQRFPRRDLRHAGVRLHHTKLSTQDQIWRYAADFKTLTGKQLGVKLERRAEGAGELVVYADPAIADEEKIIFSRCVHEHILQKGRDMVRLRHYCCPHCGTPVGNREVAMEK